jgi:hypothetical protein
MIPTFKRSPTGSMNCAMDALSGVWIEGIGQDKINHYPAMSQGAQLGVVSLAISIVSRRRPDPSAFIT